MDDPILQPLPRSMMVHHNQTRVLPSSRMMIKFPLFKALKMPFIILDGVRGQQFLNNISGTDEPI